jgi:ferredoxin
VAHHRPKNGGLVEVGPVQSTLTFIYATYESPILRLLDATTRLFLRLKGRPVLWVLSRVLGTFLPTAEVVTHEQASDFIDAISGLENTQIAVGPCMCQKALNKRSGPYMKDMVILYGSDAYKRAYGDEYHDVTPEEAKKLLKEFSDEGLIPTFFACVHSGGWIYAICNCESEICFPFRAHQAAGAVMFPGRFVVSVDAEKCTQCGQCVDRCHVGANSLDGSGMVDVSKCYGCGLCVSTCAGGAREMVERADYRNRYYPLKLVSAMSHSH